MEVFSSEQLRRLDRFFSVREEVVAVYLFGSVAERLARADSDVDVAVLLTSLPESLLEYRARLSEELEGLFQRRVQTIVLNRTSLLLAFQVIRKGRLIYERDPERRAFYQMELMSRYYDYRRYFDYHAEHLRRRMKETGFGVG